MKQLSDMAKVKAKVNHNVAPRTYLRSAVQIEKQVNLQFPGSSILYNPNYYTGKVIL